MYLKDLRSPEVIGMVEGLWIIGFFKWNIKINQMSLKIEKRKFKKIIIKDW